MFKSWKTTLLGFLGGLSQVAFVAHQAGLHAGHFGGSDFIGLGGGLATFLLGAYAKDHNVTGGTVQQ